MKLKELFNKNEGLSESEKEYFFKNHIEFEKEYSNYLEESFKNYDSKKIQDLIYVYGFFTYNYHNINVKFIANLLYESYIKNINDLIEQRRDIIIQLFLDLFYCEPFIFPNKKVNIDFIEKSYPILLIETNDSSSHIAIASYRLIAIISSEENTFYFEKYLQENPKGFYYEDISDELEELS